MDETIRFEGRGLVGGIGKGIALVTNRPISFFGEIDPKTGKIISQSSEIRGESVSNRILVFPHGRGSTVGSYIIFALKENSLAPCAIINEETEIIIAAGCSIAEIPLVDKLEDFTTEIVKNGDKITVNGDEGWIEIQR